MHGNVWEWCADCLDDSFYGQTEARQIDPLCQRETGVRARRGGSWSNAPAFLRAAQRGRNYPDNRYADIGFRVAIAPRA
jgi:formylglycine-generating enzyme required for sulfatase activity